MKILLIAPKCYPVNGAEAIVNMKLLKALSEDGSITVDLVSRKIQNVAYPSDTIESYGVRINHLCVVNNKGGISFKSLWESLCSIFVFGIVFPGSYWAYCALPAVKQLIKKNHYDFVLTKSAPSFLLGAYLKKRGLRWIASWNDPYPIGFYPKPYGKGKDHNVSLIEKLQIRKMKTADIHIFPSDALCRHMNYYLCAKACNVFIAPHVVFESNMLDKKVTIRDEVKSKLRIIHPGNLSAPRNPRHLFEALDFFVRKHPSYLIELTLLGKLEPTDVIFLDKFPKLKKIVSIIPPVEYKKSLEIVSNYDVACVVEADCGTGGGVFLPTKVTDFMQLKIPILAISPIEGVLDDLYKNGSVGYFADVSSVDSILCALEIMYNDFLINNLKKSFIPDSFRPSAVVAVYKDALKAIEANNRHA